MNKICQIFLILMCLNTYAQKKVTYKFVLEKNNVVNNDKIKHEYSINRIFQKDSVFEEKGLLFMNSVMFKVENGEWFIKNIHKWDLFYSAHKNNIIEIKRADTIYILKPVKREKLYRLDCIVYELKRQEDEGKIAEVLPNGFANITKSTCDHCHKMVFWFNSKYGFIKEESNDNSLVRQDIKSKE